MISTYEEEAKKSGEGVRKILEKCALKYIDTPIPTNYIRKRLWDYCIKSLNNGSFRLIRGADQLTVMEAIKLETIEKYISRLKKFHPHLIIERT